MKRFSTILILLAALVALSSCAGTINKPPRFEDVTMPPVITLNPENPVKLGLEKMPFYDTTMLIYSYVEYVNLTGTAPDTNKEFNNIYVTIEHLPETMELRSMNLIINIWGGIGEPPRKYSKQWILTDADMDGWPEKADRYLIVEDLDNLVLDYHSEALPISKRLQEYFRQAVKALHAGCDASDECVNENEAALHKAWIRVIRD